MSRADFPVCSAAAEQLSSTPTSLLDRPQTRTKWGMDKGYEIWGASGIISVLAITEVNPPRCCGRTTLLPANSRSHPLPGSIKGLKDGKLLVLPLAQKP